MKSQLSFITLNNTTEINQAIECIQKNGIILMPTDTVYGLSGRAFSREVFELINQIKNRPKEKRFILLVADFEMLQSYVSVSESILQKLNQFQQPTTVIYQNTKNLPAYLLASDGSIAIRVVQNESWLKHFIQQVGEPILSTSANISGQETPLTFHEIDKRVLNQVDFILKRKDNHRNIKSSQIIRFTKNGDLVYIRH